jgi:hypothetical protein
VARILLGDSDRDRLVSTLREHYAEGRLSLEDLRRRAGIVYAAAYRDEARAALDGLPDTVGVEQRPAQRRAGQRDGGRDGWPRRRGHAQARTPEAGWVRTEERFRDPSSGVIMRVWLDPADASRHYVPDDAEDV